MPKKCLSLNRDNGNITSMGRSLRLKLTLAFQAFLVLSFFFMGYFIVAKVNDVIEDNTGLNKMNNGDTNG